MDQYSGRGANQREEFRSDEVIAGGKRRTIQPTQRRIHGKEFHPRQKKANVWSVSELEQAIFNDRETIAANFQRLKRDLSIVDKQISSEHLAHLSERLETILNTHEEHGRYLDFEEVRWRVQTFVSQLEVLMMILNQKQGDLNQTESLFNEYKVGARVEGITQIGKDLLFQQHIYDEKLLANVETLLPELTRRAQGYHQLRRKGSYSIHICVRFSVCL